MEPTPTINLLKQFREKWKQELSTDLPGTVNLDTTDVNIENGSISKEQDDEDKVYKCNNLNFFQFLYILIEWKQAKALFIQASELERMGKVFEAMHLYRRAVQIIPDIEFKIYESTSKQSKEETAQKGSSTTYTTYQYRFHFN